MANLVDLSFSRRYSSNNMEYKLVMIPAYHTVLPSSIEEIELPAGIFVEDRCDLTGGFEGGVFIGCPEAMELIYDIDLNSFYGSFTDSDTVSHDWVDVGQIIVNRGYSALASDPSEKSFNYYTNRWTRYKKELTADDSEFVVDFIGFQVPGGDTRRRSTLYDDGVNSGTFELRCQDLYRSVLADCNLDDSILSQFEPTFEASVEYAMVLAANRIPYFGSDPFPTTTSTYLFQLLDEPGLNVSKLPSSEANSLKNAFVQQAYEMLNYSELMLLLGYRVYYVQCKKFRVTFNVSVLLGLLVNSFIDGSTFYKATTSKNAASTKGSAIADSDLWFLYRRNVWTDSATVEDPQFEEGWNVFTDGFLGFNNLYDLFNDWGESSKSKIQCVSIPGLDSFRAFVILKSDQAVTDSDVANSVELLPYMFKNLYWDELKDNVTSSVYHYENMSNVVADSFQSASPAVLDSQPSFEINALLDNCFPGVIPNGSDTVNKNMRYSSLTNRLFAYGMGQYCVTNSKFNNLFYLEDGYPGYQIATNPINLISYNSTDYGDDTGYPTNPGYVPYAYILNKFIPWQNSIQLSDAYPSWWVSQINDTFGRDSNLLTATGHISGQWFSPEDILSPANISKLDFNEFSGSDIVFDDPQFGFITRILSYDVSTDLYEIEIVLSAFIS